MYIYLCNWRQRLQMQLDERVHPYTNITLKLINYMPAPRLYASLCLFLINYLIHTLFECHCAVGAIACARCGSKRNHKGARYFLWRAAMARRHCIKGKAAAHFHSSRNFSTFFFFINLTFANCLYVSHIITG